MTIDTASDAAYIALSDNPVARTRRVTEDVNVDLDEMGVVVGIEVLALGAELPFAQLSDEYHIHSDVIDGLRAIRPSVGQFVLLTTSAEGVTSPTLTSPEAIAS